MVNQAPSPAKIAPVALLTSLLLAVFFAKDALTGAGGGPVNSDDLTRIVEVRDLMGGQSWFDLMQYRLGVAPGIEMHWSRLVDAPIAALVWLGNLIVPGQGETFAGYIWPFVTLLFAVWAILYGFRRVLPGAPLLPAAVVGAFSLMGGGIFAPQSFDHHNIQTALALWFIALLLPGPQAARNHTLAALLAALMLAIGMETLPYVAAGGVFVALGLLFDEKAAGSARAFGLSLAVSVVLLFVLLVGPARYLSAACDAFSSFHLVMAVSGGLALALLAHLCLSPRAVRFRLIGLAAIAAAVGLLAVLLFPHCLTDPLASLDPRLKTFWLDGVIEAQGLDKILARDPFMLPGLFGLPVLAFFICLGALRANMAPKAHALFSLMLAAALLVTCWQMRGALFGLPFAALPLALWVSRLSAAAENGPISKTILLLGAWIVSLSLFWGQIGALGPRLLSGSRTAVQTALAQPSGDRCDTETQFAPLAGESAGTILAGTNLGAAILKYTRFRTLTGAYHRNSAGNLALIDAMIGTSDQAKTVMKREKVTILAVCATGADEADFIGAAPLGFLKQLMDGTRFDWLEPVESSSGNPLRFWRVKI